jgi:hypothetical protein
MRSLCYNSLFQPHTYDGKELQGKVLNRVLALFGAVALLAVAVACGGNNGNTTVTTSNGNTITNPKNSLKNRAYISNQYSGNLQIVDTASDITAFYSSSYTNSGNTNQIADLSVNIAVGISATFLARSPNGATTAVYDPNTFGIGLVDNAAQSTNSAVALPNWAGMELFSPDSTKLYVPTGNSNAIQVIDVTNAVISTTYTVPSVRWVALNPAGTTLLAFADNSDSMWYIDLSATTITPVAITGFSRPVNAFFSSDGNTAYVLNCGNQCGGSAPPSVSQFDMPSQTIKSTVEVGGATVGLLNGNNLYVAGYAGGANGTFDTVDVSSMTRTTPTSLPINDGQQWKMALNNNKLYIGAKTCSNTVTGCLSVINLATQTPVAPLPPLGPVTGLLSIPNRTVMYTIQGGVLYIYDTNTDQLQKTQLVFRGALNDLVQIDQ